MLSSKVVKPQIIEIVGGGKIVMLPFRIRSNHVFHSVLPNSITPVAHADVASVGPALKDVVNVLNQNGINVESKQIDGANAVEVQNYINSLQTPAIVLHHSMAVPRRQLAVNNVTELSEFQISDYQICLWAGVVFVLLLGASICGLMNMDVQPDSLLYAKFQSGRTEGKRE